jgi:hypothetical protein
MRHLCSLVAAVALLAGGALLLVRLIYSDEISIKLLVLVVVLAVIGSFGLWEDFIGRHGHKRP